MEATRTEEPGEAEERESAQINSHSTLSTKHLESSPSKEHQSNENMCQGTVTILSGCGHALIHYTHYCHDATAERRLRPCPQDRVHGPLQYIDDTCSECHPPFRIAEINRRHDDFRERKTEQMRKARTRQEYLMLERMIGEAHAARGKELKKAGRVRWNGEVLWGPSREGDASQECVSYNRYYRDYQ